MERLACHFDATSIVDLIARAMLETSSAGVVAPILADQLACARMDRQGGGGAPHAAAPRVRRGSSLTEGPAYPSRTRSVGTDPPAGLAGPATRAAASSGRGQSRS